MRKEFYAAYDNLYADYVYEERRPARPYFIYEYDLIRTIRRAIDRNAEGVVEFRPDAAYFLLVNFHQMIIRPLLEARPFTPLAPEPVDLFQAITEDIAVIITDARGNGRYDQREITGHTIMRSIDNLWPILRTTKFEVWG